MIPALALALILAGQNVSLSERLRYPSVTVDEQRETIALSVQPAEGLTVRWIVLDLLDDEVKPTSTEALPKHGVRATFRHPHAPYAFVVTLSDDTRYRVMYGLVKPMPKPAPRTEKA